jgi:hypothetical protein
MAAHEAEPSNVLPFREGAAPRATSRQGQFVRYALSLAAALVIVAGAFAFGMHYRAASSSDPLDAFVNDTVVRALADSATMRDAAGMENVEKGLQASFAPVPGNMPVEIGFDLKPAKYGVVSTQQGNIGQIGFAGSDTRLLVAERRCLGGCTNKLTKPIVFDLGDRLAVSWSRGNQVYILVSDRNGEAVIRNVAKETAKPNDSF